MLFLKSGQRYLFVLLPMLLAAHAFVATFAGCRKAPVTDSIPSNNPTIDSLKKDSTALRAKYLALGDSYTIGQGVPATDCFPVQLKTALAEGGLSVDSLQIIARTGWTTLNLLQAIYEQRPANNFDMVTLLIGVNDQYQTRDTANYRSRFTECLQKAIALAGGKTRRVFVVSIPDYSVTPFGGNDASIARQIDQYNRINLDVSKQFGISYTDVTVISRGAQYDAEMTCSDGLHPSGKQYKLWATKISGNVLAAFR